MGWSFGISSWNPDELIAVKAFAAQHGSRGDGPLDEAWWAAAKDPRGLGARGMGGSYASGGALPPTLEGLVDHWLFMGEWKAAGHRVPERLVVVPFSFWLEDRSPEAVTELSSADDGRVVIVEPLRLLDHWPGFDDPAFEARSGDAWRELQSWDERLLAAEDDATYERLAEGLHRGLREIASAAWDARVAWSVCW
ncbi:MAG: hypothetical protein H6719_30100 [Sandaracinaceae bacterium]|nr:hypothetical protein [Sandaracinaceae bacterium]